MTKLILILRREFLTTIRRAGFIIMTLSIPVLGLIAIGGYQLVAGLFQAPSVTSEKIGYVDDAGGFTGFTEQSEITLVQFPDQPSAANALIKDDVGEYFVIPPDYLTTGIINRFTLQQQVEPPPNVTTAITNFLTGNMLSGKVPPATIARVKAPLTLTTTRLTPEGTVAPQQGGWGRSLSRLPSASSSRSPSLSVLVTCCRD